MVAGAAQNKGRNESHSSLIDKEGHKLDLMDRQIYSKPRTEDPDLDKDGLFSSKTDELLDYLFKSHTTGGGVGLTL